MLFKLVLVFAALANAKTVEFRDLNVGLSDAPPFSYEKDGRLQGLHYDIIKQIEVKSGLKFKYEVFPHVRLAKTLESTDVDLTILFAPLCRPSAGFEIQTRLYTLVPAVYVKKITLKKAEDLKIARLRGTCGDVAMAPIKKENIYDVSEMEQAVNMLKAGRVDGVCGIGPVVGWAMHNTPGAAPKMVIIDRRKERLESVLCRRRTLPEAVKKRLDEAAKTIEFKTPSEEID